MQRETPASGTNNSIRLANTDLGHSLMPMDNGISVHNAVISTLTVDHQSPRDTMRAGGVFWNMTDYKSQLDILNQQFGQLMLPAVSYLGVLMVLGVFGNCLVLYIYFRKLKHNTTRSFVLALGVFDLISCTVAIPGEIVDLLHNYTFGSYVLCKLLRTVNSFSAFASGLTLFVVAVDRYKKICYPLGAQISTKRANIVLLICCCVAFALASPACILYGSRTVTTNNLWVNGSDCSTSDQYHGTILPVLYNGVQFLFFVVGAVGLITLYSLIGRRIWRHRKFKVKGQEPSFFIRCSDSGSETSPATDDGNGYISPSGFVPVSVTTDHAANGKLKRPANLIVKKANRRSMTCPSSPEVTSPESPTWTLPKDIERKISRDRSSLVRKVSYRRGTIDRRQSTLTNVSKRESNARKTTLMLFVITLIFILSFLPHLVLMAIKALDKESLSGSGGLGELIINLGIRSYFINSVANPLVYGLCCQKFRSEVVKLFRCAKRT